MPGKESAKKPTPLDQAVGRNIRIWRLARGLSQAELARRLDVTFQQLQKYEVGANRVGTGRLVKVAAILGVPVATLLVGTEEGPPSTAALRTALMQDDRAFRLASAFASITNETIRLKLVELVEQVAEMSNPEAPEK